MGSPDPHQIDGIGSADALTSKVAVIKKSSRSEVDVYITEQINIKRTG